MVVSAVQLAKRVLVSLLRTLAVTYNINVNCDRDSTDAVVIANFCKLALRVHPDRGGSTAHQAKLNDAREAWDKARKAKAGRPKGPGNSSSSDRTCDVMRANGRGHDPEIPLRRFESSCHFQIWTFASKPQSKGKKILLMWSPSPPRLLALIRTCQQICCEAAGGFLISSFQLNNIYLKASLYSSVPLNARNYIPPTQ